MKILALIPARGGSKRLPGKNIMMLGERPLIGWTIGAARDSGVCASIIVSTDDEKIAQVAREQGAEVPGLRPAELATDIAGSVEVALHALEQHEKEHGPIDGLLLLQPTSPFRTAETIRAAVQKFIESAGEHPVVSVSPAVSHPSWCFRTTKFGIEPILGWESLNKRSQDLEPAFVLNGAIYLIAPAQLRNAHSFLTPGTQALIMDNLSEMIDIDTIADWKNAEKILYYENKLHYKSTS